MGQIRAHWQPLTLSRLPACENPVKRQTEITHRKFAWSRRAFRCVAPILRAESIRQSMKHGTVDFLRVLWHPRIQAGRNKRCEKGLRENHKETRPRREARTI